MDIVNLKTRLRTGSGKSYARKTRRQGWIPAVYYGHNRDTMSLEVELKEFCALVRNKKTSHLINLGLEEGDDSDIAIIKDIQKHVLTDNFYYNIDFQHINMDEKICVYCRINLVGIPDGVKDDGGILSHQTRQIEIECLPTDIPEMIDVDVAGLRIGDSVHVSDISVPKIVIKDAPEEVIAVVVQPQIAVEEVESTEEGDDASTDEASEEEKKAE